MVDELMQYITIFYDTALVIHERFSIDTGGNRSWRGEYSTCIVVNESNRIKCVCDNKIKTRACLPLAKISALILCGLLKENIE